MSTLILFDTTLRDGAHSPQARFTKSTIPDLAHALDACGLDVIELGTPAATREEFDTVCAAAAHISQTTVCVLSRPIVTEIETCAEALKHVSRKRLHVFTPSSAKQIAAQGLNEDSALELLATAVTTARRFTDDVEWSGEDASNAAPDFLARCAQSAIAAGARTISMPDSSGLTLPEDYGRKMKKLREQVDAPDDVIFSVHCHEDLGLSLANSIAGIQAGARQVECTLLGLGARAGNTALGDVLSLIKQRPDIATLNPRLSYDAVTRAEALARTMTSRA